MLCAPASAPGALDNARAEPVSGDSALQGPYADADVLSLCGRAFAAFRHGPINFEESTTRLRSSAYPVLDRIIALADACRDSVIVITGHSDASGDEAANRTLSLDRARAVAEHLIAHGVSGERIEVAGAGSSVPVADNATRYGRSLNRRIEVVFRRDGSGS